jgi:hypothetical protein
MKARRPRPLDDGAKNTWQVKTRIFYHLSLTNATISTNVKAKRETT